MQTIQLEFKQLNKLPVPESALEIMYVKKTDNNIYSYPAKHLPADDNNSYYFENLYFNSNWTYAHVKATTTQADFKVGDRVKVLGWKKPALIQKIENCALVKFENANFMAEITSPLKNLTLIPNE